MLKKLRVKTRSITMYLIHSDQISLFWFHSTTLTPPRPPGVSREAKSFTEFEFGLNSTIQLRIDSYQPAHACPWKFHNAVYTNV